MPVAVELIVFLKIALMLQFVSMDNSLLQHKAKAAVICNMATLRGSATRILHLLGGKLLQHQPQETVTRIITRNVAAQMKCSVASCFYRIFALLLVLNTLYTAFLTLIAT